MDYIGVIMYEVVLDNEYLAMELFYAIQEGEMNSMRQLTNTFKIPRYAALGGAIVRHKKMKPEISAVVFAAKPPQVLKPIVTSKGVHLILVEEIIEPKLTDMLRKKILSNLFSAWVKQQMAQSEFVTNFAPGNPNLTSGYQVINAQHLVTATFS